MDEILLDKTQEGYVQTIKIPMTEEEKNNTTDILEKNIEKIKKDIEFTKQVDLIVEDEKRKLNELKKQKELLVKNFDKWLREEIMTIKKNGSKTKLQVEQQLKNWDSLVEERLENVRKQTIDTLQTMKERLEEDEKRYEVFKNTP